jgi:hypothetical protein
MQIVYYSYETRKVLVAIDGTEIEFDSYADLMRIIERMGRYLPWYSFADLFKWLSQNKGY